MSINKGLLAFVIFFVFTFLVSSMYAIYQEVYHFPRLTAVSDELARYNDASLPDDELLRLRDRMGVGVDSLPIVRFQTHDDAPANEADRAEIERRRLRARCLSTGVFLYDRDEYVDCRSYCYVSDGVDYKFFDRTGAILDGTVNSRAGAYCLPTDATVCNENTSLLLYSKDSWRCIPQTRAFAGEGGNKIVVCNGSLLDRATSIVWKNFIDPTLRFSDIDERLNTDDDDDDAYRFVCPPDTRDANDNLMISSPFDRLQLLENFCASAIPKAADYIRPDFNTGACICTSSNDDDMLVPDPVTGVCIPHEKTFDDFELSIPDTKCVEMWSVWSSVAATVSQHRLEPCGITASADESTVFPAYRIKRVPLFDTVVMSHLAMRRYTNDHSN